MTKIDDIDWGEFNAERFDGEIRAAAGEDGISNDDLRAARIEFVRLHVNEALLTMWRRGEITFRWAGENGLGFDAADTFEEADQ